MSKKLQLDHNDTIFIAFIEHVGDDVKSVITESHGKHAIFTKLILPSTFLRKFKNKFNELLPQQFHAIIMLLRNHNEKRWV